MRQALARSHSAGSLLLVAVMIAACGGGSITAAPSSTTTPQPYGPTSPVVSPATLTSTPIPAAPTTVQSLTASATPILGPFPSEPPLPSGWVWRSDEAKTFRIATPSDFVLVKPANFYKNSPTTLTNYGTPAVFQDPRIPDREICTPDVRVFQLSKGTMAPKAYGGNGKGIDSYEALASYATNAQTVDPYAHGQQIVSASPTPVHEGYGVTLYVVEPPNDRVLGNAYHDALWVVAPDGVWVVDALACGDSAWSNLRSTFDTMESTFEAPIPGK
jgi:hypothetical protein